MNIRTFEIVLVISLALYSSVFSESSTASISSTPSTNDAGSAKDRTMDSSSIQGALDPLYIMTDGFLRAVFPQAPNVDVLGKESSNFIFICCFSGQI